MPALRKLLKFLINVVPFVIFTALTLFSQTGLDDVHVATRQTLPNQRGASSVELENSGIHVIHTDSRLVLVPVSVTDPMQRFVTGLNRDNFEVFEGAGGDLFSVRDDGDQGKIPGLCGARLGLRPARRAISARRLIPPKRCRSTR